MHVDKPVSATFPQQIEGGRVGHKHAKPLPPSLGPGEVPKLPENPLRPPHKHPQPLPPSLDEGVFRKLPGGQIEVPSFFNQFDNLIDDALSSLNKAAPGCRCPQMTPVDQALKSFHNQIKSMPQKDLDSLKDTLVKRLASPDSSQRERELMQKLYDITDAVSEHREPPHLHDFFDVTPKPMPYRLEDLIDSKPTVQFPTIKF